MVRPAPSAPEVRAALDACTHQVRGHGPRTSAVHLSDLAGAEVDTYGEGGVVEALEAEVAEVLGQPAAVFMPSGTMAQQIALRVHADRRGVPVVALHPTSHLVLHEARAHEWLHDLRTVRLGSEVRPWSRDDVASLRDPVAAVGIELPLRELGGILPPWAEVAGIQEAAHDRDAVVHLDGARIWEAAAGYGRSPADVAACADSTYVSFYKGLGAIAGAVLCGDEALVETARAWRHRHGGTVYALWPYAASALACLRRRLPRMGGYLDVTRAIAEGLTGLDGVEVVPAVPDTAMLHLHLRADADAVADAAVGIATDHDIATWPTTYPTLRPAWQAVELAAGDATVALGADRVVAVVAELVARAQQTA